MKIIISEIFKLLIIAFIFVSCNSHKKSIETQSPPTQRIEFGYFNKETRGSNTFILDEKGYIYQKNVTNSSNIILDYKLTTTEVKFFYHMVAQLKSSNSTLYEFGEKTHFVRIRDGIEIQEWKWNVNDTSLSDDLKKLDAMMIKIFEQKM
jgi:hypothetical protein